MTHFTLTAVVAVQEMTRLSCYEILSILTCLGQVSFLDKQSPQFGIGVLTRFVLYSNVVKFMCSNNKYYKGVEW